MSPYRYTFGGRNSGPLAIKGLRRKSGGQKAGDSRQLGGRIRENCPVCPAGETPVHLRRLYFPGPFCCRTARPQDVGPFTCAPGKEPVGGFTTRVCVILIDIVITLPTVCNVSNYYARESNHDLLLLCSGMR